MKNEKLRCCARLPYDTVFCIVTVLSLCVGEAYMPPGRGLTHAGFAVGCPFAPVCRAGVHARRTHIKIILKKSSVRRGQGPALQCKANTMPPRQRAMAAMFAGGMYAAPTHRPNAVATKKRYGKTNVAGRMHAAPTDQGKRHTNRKRASCLTAGSAPAGAFRTGAAAPFRSATGPQGPALSAEMANRRAAAAS